MTSNNFERAVKINHRLDELEKMRNWLIDPTRNIYVLANGSGINDSIIVSETMKQIMLEKCLTEIKEFNNEFRDM